MGVKKALRAMVRPDQEVATLIETANAEPTPRFDGARTGVSFGRPGVAEPLEQVIVHPDQLKRQELFQANSTRLDGAIDDTDATFKPEKKKGRKDKKEKK